MGICSKIRESGKKFTHFPKRGEFLNGQAIF